MTDPEDPGGTRPSIDVIDDQSVPVDRDRLASLAARALDVLGLPPPAELSITLATAARMAELKEQAFGVAAPTDVLAFPIDDPSDPAPGPLVLGDLVICPEVAARQARALGRRFEDELTQLLAHGLLHLTGEDHADHAGERAMFRRERALLRELGAA